MSDPTTLPRIEDLKGQPAGEWPPAIEVQVPEFAAACGQCSSIMDLYAEAVTADWYGRGVVVRLGCLCDKENRTEFAPAAEAEAAWNAMQYGAARERLAREGRLGTLPDGCLPCCFCGSLEGVLATHPLYREGIDRSSIQIGCFCAKSEIAAGDMGADCTHCTGQGDAESVRDTWNWLNGPEANLLAKWEAHRAAQK